MVTYKSKVWVVRRVGFSLEPQPPLDASLRGENRGVQ